MIRFLLQLLLTWATSAWEWLFCPAWKTILPPAKLRFRVCGTPDRLLYLKSGQDIRRALDEVLQEECGVDLKSARFGRILDFGCGCGRVISNTSDVPGKVHGVEVDADAVDWCYKHLWSPRRIFVPIDEAPPLDLYHSGCFNLIYAISVFSHIPPDLQLRWMEEFHRLLKSGGLLVLTLHGERAAAIRGCSNRLGEGGVYYRKAPVMSRYFSSCFHSRGYVETVLGENWRSCRVFPAKLLNYQDVVMFRKGA